MIRSLRRRATPPRRAGRPPVAGAAQSGETWYRGLFASKVVRPGLVRSGMGASHVPWHGDGSACFAGFGAAQARRKTLGNFTPVRRPGGIERTPREVLD